MTNAARLRQIEDGQTTIAKKVLQFVPIGEAWTAAAICSEMSRVTGSHPDMRVLSGCLKALRDSGLIQQDRDGNYRRVSAGAIKLAPQPGDHPMQQIARPIIEVPTPIAPSAPPKPDSLTRIAAVAQDLRRIADELEDVALDIESARATDGKDAEKLRKLQALLRD